MSTRTAVVVIPFLALFFCMQLIPNLHAQGFNVFNSRNHPYLNWQVAETEHFYIIYPERITGIEAKAASIAEESYRVLSKNTGVQFSKKIPVYLADTDEIDNGFANPIGKGYTMIWVHLNDFSVNRTGQVKWLRHVIAHELAHIFHFRAVWSEMGLLNYALGTPTPLFWTEGIAQYQTEQWSAQRGDRWLRKAIFDSRPEYRSGQSIEDGRLMYAVGNSQLRYFTETYGDSILADMMTYRNRRLGVLEYHDFYEAFREHTGKRYQDFYEEWRKHMNIYYNTLASQMERVDSLDSEALDLPGRYYFDAAVSPGDSLTALLAMPSVDRPVRNLYIATHDSLPEVRNVGEGAIGTDMSWSRDGEYLYYSRRVRGKRSAILNDIYRLHVKSGKEKRLTHSRRAGFPVEGPGTNEISYIVNENGTGNLVTRNLKSGREKRITHYEGDVQLHWPVWMEKQGKWLLYRFDENGNRNLLLLNPETGREEILDEGIEDNRKPILSPDGSEMAYTSLRDEVPNIFIYNFETRSTRRVTNLFTGGEVYGWRRNPDSTRKGQLLIKTGESKQKDDLYWVDASRSVNAPFREVPEAYTSWRMKTPHEEIPFFIEEEESLIHRRYSYRPVHHITHAASFAVPYYGGRDNWGVFATTNWTEPLGKHMFSALGWVSAANPAGYSYGAVNYINNSFYPTATLSFYRIPGNSKFYGNRFLIEELTGGQFSLEWPLDFFSGSYRTSRIGLRLRHVQVNPLKPERYRDSGTAMPVRGRQSHIGIEWQMKKQRPWRYNGIHPLDGYGIRLNVLAAPGKPGSDVRFISADLNTFVVLPSVGRHRIYLQGRYQQQWGNPFPQDYIGFSRYDNITVDLPQQVFVQLFQDAERVRGYREFVAGRQVFFGSMEYRVPLLPSLETTLLGAVNLGATSISLFSDGGVVWNRREGNGTGGIVKRWGGGIEIKNEVKIFGFGITHGVGAAQPVRRLFNVSDVEFYYRVRAAVPF